MPDQDLPASLIGQGYDIHRLVRRRRLVLGGIEITCDRGLDGHSDADVITHALADAILGALGFPDIGHFFPNTDPQWRDLDSQQILARAVTEARHSGYTVSNVDITLVAEAPKIAPHIDAMKARLGATLGLAPARIGLKATTNEGLGAIGKGEGMAAYAVCLLHIIP